MRFPERDYHILTHIISYCDQIDATVQRFGDDGAVFQNDPIYRNAAALCILQIGELVGTLSQALRTHYAQVPWRQIKAMRNIVAHRYGTVDPVTTWEVIQDDIPALKRCCQEIIQGAKSKLVLEVNMEKYVCPCGYVYDPAVGDPDNGIAPGTPWEQVPDSWVCPTCGLDKGVFEKE